MNPPSITISQERSCWWISNTCENPHVKAEEGSQKVQPSVLRESGFWTIEKWEAKKKYLSLLREVQSEKKDLRSRSRNESEMKMTGNRNREVKVKWKSFKIEIEKWNFSRIKNEQILIPDVNCFGFFTLLEWLNFSWILVSNITLIFSRKGVIFFFFHSFREMKVK